MNDKRREAMKTARKRYEKEVEKLLHQTNQEALLAIVHEIEKISEAIDDVRNNEECAYDMLTPGLQATARGMQMESCIDAMDEITISMIDVCDYIVACVNEKKEIDMSYIEEKVDFDWFEDEAIPLPTLRRKKDRAHR